MRWTLGLISGGALLALAAWPVAARPTPDQLKSAAITPADVGGSLTRASGDGAGSFAVPLWVQVLASEAVTSTRDPAEVLTVVLIDGAVAEAAPAVVQFVESQARVFGAAGLPVAQPAPPVGSDAERIKRFGRRDNQESELDAVFWRHNDVLATVVHMAPLGRADAARYAQFQEAKLAAVLGPLGAAPPRPILAARGASALTQAQIVAEVARVDLRAFANLPRTGQPVAAVALPAPAATPSPAPTPTATPMPSIAAPAPTPAPTAPQMPARTSMDVTAMALDGTGGLLVAGMTTITTPGQDAATEQIGVLRRVDAGGTERWQVRVVPSRGLLALNGLATAPSGAIYLAGAVTDANDRAEATLWSYDADGVERWVRRIPASDTMQTAAVAVTVGSDGTVYLAGRLLGALAGQTPAPPDGGLDAFVRAYDAEGAERWTHQFGTVDGDYVIGAVVQPSGRLAVVVGSSHIDPDLSLPTKTGSSIYLVDGEGAVQSVQGEQASSWDETTSMAADRLGAIYTVGVTAVEASAALEPPVVSFLRVTDVDGRERWTRQLPKVDARFADRRVAVAAPDTIYLTGGGNAYLPGGRQADVSGVTVYAFDLSGGDRWTRQLSDIGARHAITAGGDGRLYVAAGAGAALVIWVVDAEGADVWRREFR
ncbi:MAG: hypothetical protein U0531_03730 [Dehalococcoidia bacterium]